MPTICIQCSMRAMAAGKQPPIFEESPEEHQRLHHPDVTATMIERMKLEMAIDKRLTKDGGVFKVD